jgi:hypothetical protein
MCKTDTKRGQKKVKSKNFCYCKVGKAITKLEAIEITSNDWKN